MSKLIDSVQVTPDPDELDEVPLHVAVGRKRTAHAPNFDTVSKPLRSRAGKFSEGRDM